MARIGQRLAGHIAFLIEASAMRVLPVQRARAGDVGIIG